VPTPLYTFVDTALGGNAPSSGQFCVPIVSAPTVSATSIATCPKCGQHGVFPFDRSAADSRLSIVPRGEQGHVVLKVESADDGRLVCWIFIRQGESAETPIPSGSYRLKLACGKTWYGEEHLFGPGASYSAITTEIAIPTRTVSTIDLHPSTEGVLKERTLRPQDF
jgi:hypothetical protein